MYHSITFGTKNTWDDWHLIPTTRPVFNPPTVKASTIDLPGGDGVLDLTEFIAGRPLYNNRTGSFEFIVDNDFMRWEELYSEILNYLHGRSLKAVLEDDPGYYYQGRFTVNQWNSDKLYSKITIDYDVFPYKKETGAALDQWLGDPVNFKTGIIRVYKNIQVDGTKVVRVVGSTMPTNITITASATGMTVTFQGVTYELPKGSFMDQDIVIVDGINELTFTGSGIISIDLAGGKL